MSCKNPRMKLAKKNCLSNSLKPVVRLFVRPTKSLFGPKGPSPPKELSSIKIFLYLPYTQNCENMPTIHTAQS